jgi:ribosomal protein S15P/S13E
MSINVNPNEPLTAKQEKAVVALLSEPTIKSAAQLVKVSEITLIRWLREDTFKDAYQEARREATKQAIARLQQASSEAVDTLRDVMNTRSAQPGARVSAAKTVLELSIKAVELEDLAQRIEELEKHIEEQKKK